MTNSLPEFKCPECNVNTVYAPDEVCEECEEKIAYSRWQYRNDCGGDR